nr:integrase, catalytic region, zinc finger, CCHC-type, peptidase aspartic, catalytic [Tanacetum cinerariifolium]
MANLLEDIQCTGSDTRPPMHNRTDFASWQQRIRLYCRGKNRVNILKSIDEGPFQMGMFRQTLAEGKEGTFHLGPERPRVYSDPSPEEKDRYNADIRATNILLQGLPKDIYTLINHYTDAKDIWDNVKMLLEGSELTKEDHESQLHDEFKHFRQHKGETIHDYYVRFSKLINDIRNIKMTMSRMQLNSKFVNNMLPEWGRLVVAMKLNRRLRDSNYDQLYAYLKQHEAHANENKMMVDRIEVKGTMHEMHVQLVIGALRTELGMQIQVHDHDHYPNAVCEHHEVHEMHDDVQPNYVVDSHVDYTSDSNMIPYDQYAKDNANKVVDNSLSIELATYKEQVELYERRAKFELTEREQRIHSVDIQLSIIINHNKSLVEEVTSLKKDFIQKENKHLKEFLDMKALKEKVDDKLYKQDQSLQTVHMLCKPKSYYDEQNKSLHFPDMHEALSAAQKRITELEYENSNLQNKIQNDDHDVMVNHFSKLEVEHLNLQLKFCNRETSRSYSKQREVHLDYFKHLKESVETLSEIVEEAKVVRPLDKSLTSVCLYTKHSQELLEYVIETCLKDFNQQDKKHAASPLTKKKQVTFIDPCKTSTNNTLTHVKQQPMHQTNELAIPSTGVKGATTASGSKPKSNTKKDMTLRAQSDMKKVEVHPKNNKSSVKRKNQCSKHMTGDRSWLRNFVKKFIGTVRFGNDHFGAIMGYGDYIISDSMISMHSCYVRDTDGVELIKGSRVSNLYTISIEDMMKSSPICLLSKASKNKSWLWHRYLNYLNFNTINDLAKKDLVRGLSRFKFEKDHLCSACQLVSRTPQQNDIVERRNHTLVEAARTMLIFSKAPMFLWAKAVATAC